MQTLFRSKRSRVIQPFKVMEMVKRANALAQAGHPVIHLSIGEPDTDAAPEVSAALIHNLSSGKFPYTEARGLGALREAIARYYLTRYGVAISSERILVTAGASGALTLACAALLDPGDEVLMADPSYPCNRHFVAAFDGAAKLLPCNGAQRFQPTLAQIQSQWSQKSKGVLLATPANPTGTAISFSTLTSIVDWVSAKGGFSIIDEIYLELSYNGKPQSILQHTDQVFVANSFSKFFSMTGWRLGWLVLPPDWVPIFETLQQNLYICPSSLAQQAALQCFTDNSLALMDQRTQNLRERRDYLIPALKEAGLVIPCEPDGAFYIYADISHFGLTAAQFADALLNKEYVAVVPGNDFGENQSERYIRLSYATELSQLEEAVKRIKRFTQSLTKPYSA
jgi:aspartate/methionine/tyrosine aminotransferase